MSAAGLLIQSLGISHPLRLYNLFPHRGFLTGEYYTIILLHQLGKKGLLATVCYHHARGGKISEEKEEKSSKNKGLSLSLSSLAPYVFCTGDVTQEIDFSLLSGCPFHVLPHTCQ